jgi:hypothetical protein
MGADGRLATVRGRRVVSMQVIAELAGRRQQFSSFSEWKASCPASRNCAIWPSE